MKLSQALLLTTILISSTIAHPEYRQRIPNSMNIVGVDALGHVDPAGGGPRNAFGNDFDSAGRKWTTALCQKDSDGDGQTNGQELGDPCCQWVQTTNAQVLWSKGVSAPGDATSKSNPSLWANVTCTTSTPSTTTTPGPSTGTAPERHGGITAMAIALVCTVAIVNVIGV